MARQLALSDRFALAHPPTDSGEFVHLGDATVYALRHWAEV